MIVVVFWLGYQLFASIDTQIAAVRTAPAVTTPASPASSPDTVVAQPRPDRSLAQVAAAIGLKLLGLVALAYIGALVAARGAQLASASRGKS